MTTATNANTTPAEYYTDYEGEMILTYEGYQAIKAEVMSLFSDYLEMFVDESPESQTREAVQAFHDLGKQILEKAQPLLEYDADEEIMNAVRMATR